MLLFKVMGGGREREREMLKFLQPLVLENCFQCSLKKRKKKKEECSDVYLIINFQKKPLKINFLV